MSKQLFTADWHFGHWADENRGVIQYCDRPFPAVAKTQEMNEALIAGMLRKIESPDDVLFVLGDCFFRMTSDEKQEVLSRIPCKKILIRGNHDDRTSNSKFISLGFDAVYRHMTWYDEQVGVKVVLNHDPVATVVCKDAIVLCGHIHQLWKTSGRCINVGVDVWNFEPCDYDEDIRPLMKTLVKTPFSEYADAHKKTESYLARQELIKNSLSTAPDFGNIK